MRNCIAIGMIELRYDRIAMLRANFVNKKIAIEGNECLTVSFIQGNL